MHRDRPHRIWPSATAAGAAVLIVTIAGFFIVGHPAWSRGEIEVVAAVHDAGNGFLDGVARTINIALGVLAPLLVLLSLGLVLLVRRSWRDTLRIGLVLCLPWLVGTVIKNVIQRPRPDTALLSPIIIPDPETFSYPSGHTGFATAIACAVIFVLTSAKGRWISVPAGIALVLVTGWSRVYLGVHYPTDVAASMLLIPFVSFATAVATRRWLGPAGTAISAQPFPQTAPHRSAEDA